MRVLNSKERIYAKWRFAGIYILSVALPALLISNAYNVSDDSETAMKVEYEQLKKENEKLEKALQDVSQLAVTLNEVQQLKPPFLKQATDQARYDKLRFDFEDKVENLKELFHKDQDLYSSNYSLVAFLEANHKKYQEIGNSYWIKIDSLNALIAQRSEKLTPSNCSAYESQIIILTENVKRSNEKVNEMKIQLAGYQNISLKLQQIRETATDVNHKISNIILMAEDLKSISNGIQKKKDIDDVQKLVLPKIESIRSEAQKALSTNSAMAGYK